SFSVLNTVIAPQGLDGGLRGREGEFFLMRRQPPVDGDRAALVLDQDTLLAGDDLPQAADHRAQGGMVDRVAHGELSGDAVLQPMEAGHVEFMWHEAPVEELDRATADDRERAAEPSFQPGQDLR